MASVEQSASPQQAPRLVLSSWDPAEHHPWAQISSNAASDEASWLQHKELSCSCRQICGAQQKPQDRAGTIRDSIPFSQHLKPCLLPAAWSVRLDHQTGELQALGPRHAAQEPEGKKCWMHADTRCRRGIHAGSLTHAWIQPHHRSGTADPSGPHGQAAVPRMRPTPQGSGPDPHKTRPASRPR